MSDVDTAALNRAACLRLLHRWARASQRFWYDIPGRAGLGVYGTGYNHWGVQTNQKYLAAMAVLAEPGEPVDCLDRQWALERALAALRFSLMSHRSGDFHCTDGTAWGHTWISGLGVERMMHGVDLLEPHLTDEDQRRLREMLTSEAEWLLTEHRRGRHGGIAGGMWNESGRNWPESNLWNGALLWRTAALYPDHPRVPDWQEQAHRFLINSVSVPADSEDDRIVAGKPIRERFAGANFFPHYALDHHGYLNVGYMAICVSNAAILHFDLKRRKLPRPESLDHHQADLWGVLRRMIFSDGRLARIGGDSRIRYAYCQEYLLPSLLYAADHLDDPYALDLAARQFQLIEREADYSGDGAFYSRRLAHLIEQSPYYYTRLESDRANVLGMAALYLPEVGKRSSLSSDPAQTAEQQSARITSFESSVAGAWCEADHGAVMHRSPTRLASFAWRAYGLAQGMCQPPDDGHLAEWRQNLSGCVRFLGDDGAAKQRALRSQRIADFPGGFATAGTVIEGMMLQIPEGWRGTQSAEMKIAFVALPDGHTVVGLQHCRTAARRTYLSEVKGMLLNLPNDLYNRLRRRLTTARGTLELLSPAEAVAVVPLGCNWVNIDGRIGVLGLYGARELSVHRAPHRRGGTFASLYVEQICFGCDVSTRPADPHQLILDVGFAVVSSASAEQTARLAAANSAPDTFTRSGDCRTVRFSAMDGRNYVITADFAAEPVALNVSASGKTLADVTLSPSSVPNPPSAPAAAPP